MEKFYHNTPLEKIPWYHTQADYFLKILNSGKLTKGKALDLGCGVGTKSIALAKKGFKVVGIDISPTAIQYAKENAKKERIKAQFFAADATDLSFLKNDKFDFILDWACLHSIPVTKRKKYINGIIKYTKKGGKLLLRCFSKYKNENKSGFSAPAGFVYLFSKDDIEELFGKHFKVLETNRSKPKTHPGKWLDEYLMERF